MRMNKRAFLIMPGRSGNHWIHHIIDEFTEADTLYEEQRFFNVGNNLSYIQRKGYVDYIWDQLPGYYFSSSLLIKNGFLMPLAERGAKFIHIKREYTSNAISWYKMGGVPGRTYRGKQYFPKPWSGNNCLLLKDWESLHDYELIYWAIMETNARGEFMKESGANVYSITLEQLNDLTEVNNLLRWLDFGFVEQKQIKEEAWTSFCKDDEKKYPMSGIDSSFRVDDKGILRDDLDVSLISRLEKKIHDHIKINDPREVII